VEFWEIRIIVQLGDCFGLQLLYDTVNKLVFVGSIFLWGHRPFSDGLKKEVSMKRLHWLIIVLGFSMAIGAATAYGQVYGLDCPHNSPAGCITATNSPYPGTAFELGETSGVAIWGAPGYAPVYLTYVFANTTYGPTL
jgi:hypothetical protein